MPLKRKLRTLGHRAIEVVEICLRCLPDERDPCDRLLQRAYFTSDAFNFEKDVHSRILKDKGHPIKQRDREKRKDRKAGKKAAAAAAAAHAADGGAGGAARASDPEWLGAGAAVDNSQSSRHHGASSDGGDDAGGGGVWILCFWYHEGHAFKSNMRVY